VTIPDKHQINSFSAKNVLRRVDSTQYGELLLDVIALQLETSDAIGDIVNVLDDIVDDLVNKQEEADEENKRTVADCNEKDAKYSEIISQANQAINDANSSLVTLRSEKIRLEGEIDRVEGEIRKNRKDRADAVAEREAENALYLERLAEHDESIEATKEAIELLNQLKKSPAGASNLVQIRKTSTTLMNLREKIQKMDAITSTYTPFLKVLLEIAASQDNFDKEETINKIGDLLNELKGDLEKSRDSLIRDEENAQAAHDEYVATLDVNYDDLVAEEQQLRSELSANIAEIARQERIVSENKTLVDETQKILDSHRAVCKLKIEIYEQETKERNEELDLVDEVKQIFAGLEGDMRDYLKERINA
jgi:DNA repair exonuclease SbcCD ATPase subunit